MSKFLMTTAAAALLIGGSVAMAQSPNGEKGAAPARAPAAQQNAPAEKIAPKMNTHGAVNSKSETTGQGMSNDSKAGAKGDVQMKSDEKAGAKGAQMNEKSGAKGNAQMKSEEKPGAAKGQASEKSNAQMKNKEAQDKDMKSKSGAASNENAKTNATTGQGAAGARANLTTEQRTKITTVIKKQTNVRPVEHVNFSISVGTRVPHTVHLYPLPAEVISVYPAWRGYEFILVGDEIVIINPGSFEIVAVIAA